MRQLQDGHFGEFGGRFIPETLMPATDELSSAYECLRSDTEFWVELDKLAREYVGRPTPLYEASRLARLAGGARIFLKREDLAHTGAHKINNALGQALLAKRMGKHRVIAETGAGQHGVACATVCAMLGLECIVYMGDEDVRRQSLNVFRMKMLGARVVPVTTGSRTLKDAVNEAFRDWVTNVKHTYFMLGSVVGPHPYPRIVRDFQSVIGKEARQQMLDATGSLPGTIVACVGGGSNAMGIFHAFYQDEGVNLVGVEAAGRGLGTGEHSATLCSGTPGVLHGTYTYVLQDSFGQVLGTHSISAGLDYPAVGPEHSYYKRSGRATYVAVTDEHALEGFRSLAGTEGIIPALESAHAVYHAMQIAAQLPKQHTVLVNLSGRGDKDMSTVASELGVSLT